MSASESTVELAAIEWLAELGWPHIAGPTIAPDGEGAERVPYRDVVLEGRERGDLAWLFDSEDPSKNDWLVVSQLTVVEGKNKRGPDLVLYVNGLPFAVIEFSSPSDPNATIEGAHNKLQLYKDQIPVLFTTNEVPVVSDGTEVRVGSLTAGVERFGPWRTIDGEVLSPEALPRLQVLLAGLSGVADVRTGWGPLFAGRAGFVVWSHQAWFRWVAEAEDAPPWAAHWLAWVGDRYGYAAEEGGR